MAQRVRPKQALDQDVTMETSIQQIHTLLETGVACITYLRGIFGEDSFEEAQFQAPRPPVSVNNPAGSQKAEQKKGDSTSVKVKKLVRGSNDEANKLLNYIEHGASDALRQGYLHQLVLAIYLDPDDPTNIVEAYTFTFTYETDAEGNKRPEMDVRDKLGNMAISTSSSSFNRKKSKVKDGDVKRQAQRLLKNLITSTQALDELPRRRFLAVRLYYTDDCPADYQPPLFSPVDASQSAYSITTEQAGDPPEVGTLGAMNTGFHGVTLHTLSIAHLLDVEYDENISLDECLDRNQRDAATRNVVWDADDLVESVTDEDAKLKTLEPVGIRDEQGRLRTIAEVEHDEKLKDVRLKVGLVVDEKEQVVLPRGEADLAESSTVLSDNAALQKALASDAHLSSSQAPATQPSPVVSRQKSFRPPVPFFDEAPEAYAERSAVAAERQVNLGRISEADIDGVPLPTVDEDAEMRDEFDGEGVDLPAGQAQGGPGPATRSRVQHQAAAQGFPVLSMNAFNVAEDETQLLDYTQHAGASPAVGDSLETIASTSAVVAPQVPPAKECSSPPEDKTETGACECGDSRDDDAMICCSSCDVWKHCCCYGFEGADDVRIPEEFVCYPCRATPGPVEALLNPERLVDISGALDDLRSLALFRRAIDVVWKEGVQGQSQLSMRLAIDPSTAAQLITRLRDEHFMVDKSASAAKGKGKHRAKKPQITISKSVQQTYFKSDTYFNPGDGAESQLAQLLDSSEIDAQDEAEGRRSTVTPRSLGKQPDDQTLVPSTASRTSTTTPGRSSAVQGADAVATSSLTADAPHFASPRRITSHEMPEDDPIADFDEESFDGARSEKVAQKAQGSSCSAAQAPMPVQQDGQPQPPKKALYVPDFPEGRGVGKSTTSSHQSPFRGASSANVMPASEIQQQQQTTMDLDDDYYEDEPDTIVDTPILPAAAIAAADPTATLSSSHISTATSLHPTNAGPLVLVTPSTSSGKRGAAEVVDAGSPQPRGDEGGISARRSKRNKRCSEAAGIEV